MQFYPLYNWVIEKRDNDQLSSLSEIIFLYNTQQRLAT